MSRAAAMVVLLALATSAAAQPAPDAAPAAACEACPELALVPPGAFTLGTPGGAAEVDAATGESPPVGIAITRPFYIGAREVTVGEFRRFIESAAYEPPRGCRVWRGGQWVLDRDRSWRDPGFAQPPADHDPVVCVNWVDARAYVEWLAKLSGQDYRLPSEAEWEYVARGGTSFARFWGARDSDEGSPLTLACEYANVHDVTSADAYRLPGPHAACADGAAGVAAAGSYKPNAFGAWDMIGNVREWLHDCYTASYQGRPLDGRAWTWQGGCELKAVRGGSWASRPALARAAARGAEPTLLRQSDLGFRVARDYD